MSLMEVVGYDRNGTVTEVETTLSKGRLSTYDITLAALAFNAPAYIAASAMPLIYTVAGHAAPLAMLIAFVFPMSILAVCLIRLVRSAPSAGGVFTYADRFLHPRLGTVLGWTYTVMAATTAPLSAVIGAEYIQAMFPSSQGDYQARVIGTLMLIVFFIVSSRGIELTAKVAGAFLAFEVLVVAGLGICGIVAPQVHDLSLMTLYSVKAAGGWPAVAQGILFGVFMLANFDSAINYIEEAKVPVRTVQRSLVFVLTSALVVYSLAAIGWQYAVPIERLASFDEDGTGGPIAAVAAVYLPPSLTWIALFVVVTSSCAGMQASLNSGARTLYRMSYEGHLPLVFSRTNHHKAPSAALIGMAVAGTCLVWIRPLAHLIWYVDTFTITLVMAYIATLAACIRLLWTKYSGPEAFALSILPACAVAVLLYVGYTAGTSPSEPSDRYNAWFMGIGVLVTGGMLSVLGQRRRRAFEVEAERALAWHQGPERTDAGGQFGAGLAPALVTTHTLDRG